MDSQVRRDEFVAWMAKQTKPNGGPYSPATIETYVYTLKAFAAKLHSPNIISSDLFYYSTPLEFLPVYHEILRHPELGQLEKKSGHTAYSNGLKQYLAFLNGQDKAKRAWVFQGNPKYYDIIGLIQKQETFEWAAKQNAVQMQKGDRVYIWMAGTGSGIVAAGELMNSPEERPWKNNDPYQKSEQITIHSTHKAVDIRINRDLTSDIISRSVLAADDRTHKMLILKQPQGTNYAVTAIEESVIESLIDKTYEAVPVVAKPEGGPIIDVRPETTKHWIYAPGSDAKHWETYLKQGILGLGWNEIGDLRQYDSKSEIRAALEGIYEGENPIQSAHMLWCFSREMNIGDVIYVKKGRRKILGRGIIESDCYFDESSEEHHHLRKVQWTHSGEWDWQGTLLPMKSLTDVTYDRALLKSMSDLLDQDIEEELPPRPYEPYGRDNFLNDVFWSEIQYDTVRRLLLCKKNLILQGAPGVGKTFAAERLAWSVMEEKDRKRCMFIQFHQSYGYEDFIMGYRPTSTGGFELKHGPFYGFCKMAEEDDRPYFLIIDEINRGNLSKIFGELLMLIEADKRGRPIRLLYGDELFAVPENVHIIGMMNTADRSLALIDYALRRRFTFFEIEPGFETNGFKKMKDSLEVGKECFEALIDVIKSLNIKISEDPGLGRGFRIGHSYFCLDEISEGSLEAIVDYEIIPLLEEYWFDSPEEVKNWSERLRLVTNGNK